jgi:hypothetical protein
MNKTHQRLLIVQDFGYHSDHNYKPEGILSTDGRPVICLPDTQAENTR